MKRINLIACFIMAVLFVSAQNQTTNEPGFVYSLPRTELNIILKIEKTVSKPGIYYQYSERYLATNKVITEESTKYRIAEASFYTSAQADPNRTYQVSPDKKSNLNFICVDAKGILTGINSDTKVSKTYVPSNKNNFSADKIAAPQLLPLGEEYMQAGSVAKLAEGAAKQIYRIRESKLSLLTGDLEHMPADGKSVQTMLDGLNKAEKDLTELFIGSTTITTEYKTISFQPTTALTDETAFRFSVHKGIVEKDDMSGNPYFLTVKPEMQAATAATGKNNTTYPVYTVIPARTKVTLSDGINVICSLETVMPQFGQLIPLPMSVIEQPNVKIQVDPLTGRLLSITK